MQMILQQSLMNQTLLGLGAYGPLGSYAMLAAAASGSTQSGKVSVNTYDALMFIFIKGEIFSFFALA